MPQSYTEGQRLLGSDGQIYIVRGGVPTPEGGSTDVSRIVAPSPVRVAKEAQDRARLEQSQQFDAQRIDMTAANNKREADRTRLQNPQDLRQEYEKLPEVQAYRTMLSVATKATNTAPGPQGDLSLTYAYSKAMDPTSSVREGEQAAVAGSQPALQAIVEKLKKQFGVDGAGNFTPQARAALRMEIFRAAAAMKPLYDRARADMEDHSRAVGVDPKEVIGRDDTATYAPMFRAYGEKNGDDGTISRLIGGEPIKGADIPTPSTDPMKAAPAGSTEAGGKIPPEMQQEYSAYLNQNWGKLNPSDFAAFRINLDRKYGFGSNSEGYRSDAEKINDIARKGGTPQAIGPLTPPDHKMTAFEELRNDAVSNPYGAAAATTMNGVGFGLPSLLAGDQFNAIRKDHPGAALLGDIAGGIGGSMLGGGALKLGANALERGGAEGVAKILANPLTADVGYGTVFGGNDAAGRGDNWLAGGATGALGGFVGNKVGGAIGKAFPGSVGVGGAIKKLDASVPTSDDLKTLASGLYGHMESNGLTAAPADTFALADSIKATLAKEGRITPKDNLAATESPVNTAYKLVNDYAGEPMDPAQYQVVRTTIADALDSKTKSDKRVGKALLKTFDDWTEATNPAMKETWDDARAVSSRYIQGDALKEAADLAGVRAGQFSQAGMENALRVDYRALARDAIKKNGGKFTPETNLAIRGVTDGSGMSNTLRTLGGLAPVSPGRMAAGVTALGAGAGFGGPLGAAGVVGVGGLSTGARALASSMTKRAAQVAENTAYGGPEYTDALQALIARAGARAGDIGTGMTAGAVPYENDIVARLLRARNGAY